VHWVVNALSLDRWVAGQEGRAELVRGRIAVLTVTRGHARRHHAGRGQPGWRPHRGGAGRGYAQPLGRAGPLVHPQPLRRRGVLALTTSLTLAALTLAGQTAGRLSLGRLQLRSLVLRRGQARGHAIRAED
jgi:hypothetical protein